MTCSCHGEPAMWHKDPRSKHGGYWRCRITHRNRARAWQRAYRATRPELVAQDNEQRMFIAGTYVGRCGFTKQQRKELISGTTD